MGRRGTHRDDRGTVAYDLADPDRPRRLAHLQFSSGTGAAGHLVWRGEDGDLLMSAEVTEAGWDPGVISVRVAGNGSLTKGPQWHGSPYTRNNHPGGGIERYAELPGDRLVACNDAGCWILAADTLRPSGFTKYPAERAPVIRAAEL